MGIRDRIRGRVQYGEDGMPKPTLAEQPERSGETLPDPKYDERGRVIGLRPAVEPKAQPGRTRRVVGMPSAAVTTNDLRRVEDKVDRLADAVEALVAAIVEQV